jgi:putative endonuclease
MFVSNPTGKKGEDLASKYLENKGYKIIERNFRKGYGEIDIIATHRNTLIFVEVKTRSTSLFGGAIEAITYQKLQKLIKTCEFYKMTHYNLPDTMRIDAILIDLIKNAIKSIQHVENISG